MANLPSPATNLPMPGLPPGTKLPDAPKKMLGIPTEPIYFKRVPYEEVLDISSALEDYHKLFYTFFEMASMNYTNAIPTAAVRFHRFGKADLLLGEEFWKSLTKREQTFVIMHECMHVMLDHGVRNGKNVKGSTPYLVIIAQDITINEMIVDLFGFDRKDLRGWQKYCWISTCFEDPKLIKRNENFTYYLEMLIKHASEDVKNGSQGTMDDHAPPGTPGEPMTAEEEDKAREKLAKDLAQEMTADELGKIKDALPDPPPAAAAGAGNMAAAGNMAGTYEVVITRKTAPVKLKIHKLIAKLKRTRLRTTEVDVETFVRKDRRFNSIRAHNPDVHLPGTSTYDKLKKDKLLVALYTDISGSCISYIPLFKRILKSFMDEDQIMDTIAHTFDTCVQKVTYDTPIRGGGGTYFHIIEEQNRILEAEYGRYPDCVVIITDGDGNQVQPKMPKRWIWLLTPNPNTSYIHSQSRKFATKDVVFE